ncbi:FtsB family cell division protein [Treponema sp. R6D11]
MRVFKYLIGVWTAIVVYTLFSFLGGPSGLSSYNYLLAEKERQCENIKDLGIINEELERTRFNLQYDQDTMLVQARQMGYGQSDERFIRIVGLGTPKSAAVRAGNVYSTSYPDYISDKNIKIAAFCAGLLVFAFILMMEIIEKKSR